MNGNQAHSVMQTLQERANTNPVLNFIMYFLQWFVVPVETLLRRDFGQRYYTKINFFAGLIVLLWFNLIDRFGGFLGAILGGLAGSISQRDYENPSFLDTLLPKIPLLILLAYILLGSYHFFKIRWRNYNGMYQHSREDGTSRLIGLAAGFMDVVNAILKPINSLYMNFLPARQRNAGQNVPPRFTDVDAFTKTFFEPLFLIVVGILFALMGGVFISIWVFMSAIALAIFSSWREEHKLNNLLDVLDKQIEADDHMRFIKGEPTEYITTAQKEIVAHIAEKAQESPEAAAVAKADFPDLDDIISQMHDKPKG
jgi:hypothetical protein